MSHNPYKRYMVFTWAAYDNVSPFECVSECFDTEKEAKEYASEHGELDEDYGDPLWTIFDRVEGIHLS